MSLILGVHLPTRLFLAADTRLTVESDGKKAYRDNFWKVADLSPQVACATAGNARLAGFLLRKIGDSGVAHDNITTFRTWLEVNLPAFIDEYMRLEGEYKKVAIIFGGYDRSAKKKVNSSRLGEVMSKPFVGKGDGVRTDLATNRTVIQGLLNEGARRGKGHGLGPVPKDTEFEIDFADSSMFAVEIDLPKAPEFRTIPCYGVVLFGQGGLREEHATADLVQKLEVETGTTKKGVEGLYAWSLPLAALIEDMIAKHGLQGVGGDKLTMLLTPAGNAMPMGTIKKPDPKTGALVRVSDTLVHDGKFCTRGDDGTITPFEQVMNFNGAGNSEI